MIVFYRKYRPQKLAEVFGQEEITRTLLAQLQSGKISHGYLFSGPKGTGKTSTARILAKAVNCDVYGSSNIAGREKKKTINVFGEPCNKCVSCLAIANGSHLDLIEIDAASNRGIDEIRDLKEKIRLSPVSGRFKVYIIDEAHMLTAEAFNALLKTLEEPPAHAILILCTTESSRLPATIISRLARFNFVRASDRALASALEKIAKVEKLKIEKEALAQIIKAADGSFRDAVSILDQLSSESRTILSKNISRALPIAPNSELVKFVDNLVKDNPRELVFSIDSMDKAGLDLSLFAQDLVLMLERIMLFKIGALNREDFLGDDQLYERLAGFAAQFSFENLQKLMKLFLVAENEIKIYPLSAIPLVLAVCQYCQLDVAAQGSDLREVEVETEAKTERKQEISRPKKSAENSAKLSDIGAKWSVFLQKVKPYNSHVSALLRAARPVDFDGRKLTVEVFYRFHKEKLQEPKIIKMLEETMGELVGGQFRLDFVLAAVGKNVPKVVEASDVIEVDQGELEKISQELFVK